MPSQSSSTIALGSSDPLVEHPALSSVSGAMALRGSDLIPAFCYLAHETTPAQPNGPPVKRRRLGKFIFAGLPKPAPRYAARDAVSPAVVANPDPTAGSSSRNAAPLQDVPPCTQACSSSSSQAKSSPEVHLLGNAAANSIALPNVLSVTEGQPELQVSSASPAGFIISPKPQPAGSITPSSSSLHLVVSGNERYEQPGRQLLSKRTAFVLGPKLSKMFRAEDP